MKNVIRLYRIMFRQFPHMKWQIPLRAVAMVASPLIESAIPAMAIAMILDRNIERYMIGISLLLLIDVAVRIMNNFLTNRHEDYGSEIRIQHFWPSLLKKSLSMDYCNMEPADKQDKMQKGLNALNGSDQGVNGLVKSSFALACYSVGLLSYGAIVTTVDVRILLIMGIMSIVGFTLHRHAVKYSDAHTKERDQALRGVGALTWEARKPECGKDVRIYHMEHWFQKIFKKYFRQIERWYTKTEIHWYFSTLSDQIFHVLRDLLMYSILIHNVIRGTMTVSEFSFYIGVVAGFGDWVTNFFFQLSYVMKTNLESKAYFEVMEQPDVFRHGMGEKLDLTAPVSIEFKDVSFGYEEGSEILSHLSFRIEQGQKIALVGNNGAGKTTIVKLLCGFYLPTSGEVLINGIPTSEYDIDAYRQGISAVFQDGFLAPFRITQNIAGGEEEIDRAKVRNSLQRAGLWKKIAGLPDQEDSYITQQLEKTGVDFSGGERQKLLIARSYYQDGRLLILDEPTSALDPIAESEIYEKYHAMTQGKTALFISHRLASTKFCDEILFLEKGKVIERGTHEELMNRQGVYAEIFGIQSHYYKEEANA